MVSKFLLPALCRVAAEDGSPVAYLWLSRSRTEPVCRVMVDVKDADMAEHDRLLAWQRSMVERADRALS